MKVHSPSLDPIVKIDPEANRPVLLHMLGLVISMNPYEARNLADALHDGADKVEGSR
ncbi:hypothetical protein [Rhodococcus gordoniae]|uniref:hypothetical protein n=1 Tax=Rhodococcus gordoniae TaxID=223392 RepID=UPI0020CC795C|nr:hypothetical protein [Rhodococcus gordoniae]UTT48848.1 hypothetical protein NMQ04_01080 [Rhodococcus gordoniae]